MCVKRVGIFQHGADTLLDYASEDLRRRLMGLTEGKGADVVLDPVGGVYAEAVQRNPRQHAANVRQLLQWFVAGSVRPEITEQLGLEHATQALLRLSQREAKGKIVVRIVAESGF
ncbi:MULTISPECIES: zinc-binding dehydrogenase [unclassified Thiomonas]|uniref:zinc-binding dehydrogenase n=1 Tax=unclassified Thiomonas TaxID=2625466 RepID=UPI0004DBAF9D